MVMRLPAEEATYALGSDPLDGNAHRSKRTAQSEWNSPGWAGYGADTHSNHARHARSQPCSRRDVGKRITGDTGNDIRWARVAALSLPVHEEQVHGWDIIDHLVHDACIFSNALELIRRLRARAKCCILHDAWKPDDLEGRVGGKLAESAYLSCFASSERVGMVLSQREAIFGLILCFNDAHNKLFLLLQPFFRISQGGDLGLGEYMSFVGARGL